RGEHGDAQRAEQVAGPPQRLSVDLHAMPAGRCELGLEQQPTSLPIDLGPDGTSVAALAHQGVGGRAAERRQRRQIPDGFEEVALALPVVADHDRQARRGLELGRPVVAEVGEPEAGDPHGSYETRTGISRYRESDPSGERTTAGLSVSSLP